MAENPNKPNGENITQNPYLNPEIGQTNGVPTLEAEKKDIKDLKKDINIGELKKKSTSEIIQYCDELEKVDPQNTKLDEVKKLLGEKLLKEPSYIPEAVKKFGVNDLRDDIIWKYISSTKNFVGKFRNYYQNAKFDSEVKDKNPEQQVLIKKAGIFKYILLNDFKLSQQGYETYLKELYNGNELGLGENIDEKVKFEEKFEQAENMYQDMLKSLGNPKEMPKAFKELVLKEGFYGAVRDLSYKSTKMGYGNAKMLATIATLGVMIGMLYKAYKGKSLGKLLLGGLIGHFALAGTTGYGLGSHLKKGFFGGYDEIIDKNRSLYNKLGKKGNGGKDNGEDEYKIVSKKPKQIEELVKKAETDGTKEALDVAYSLAMMTVLFDEEATYGDVKKFLKSDGKKLDFDLDKYIADLKKQGRNQKADEIETEIKANGKDKFIKHLMESFDIIGINAQTYDKIPESEKIIDLGKKVLDKTMDKSNKPETDTKPGISEKGEKFKEGEGVEGIAENATQYHIESGKAFLIGPDGKKQILDINISTSEQKMDELEKNNPKLYLAVIAGQIMASYYQANAEGMYFKWTSLRSDEKMKSKAKIIMDTVNSILNEPDKHNDKLDNTLRNLSVLLFDGNEEKARDFRAAVFDGNTDFQEQKVRLISFFRDKYNMPFVIGGLLEKEILKKDEFKSADELIQDEDIVEKLVSNHLDILDGGEKNNIYEKFKATGLSQKQIDEFLEKATQLKKSVDTMRPKDKNKIVEKMKGNGFEGENTDIFDAYKNTQKHIGIKMLLKSTVLEGMIKNKPGLTGDKFVKIYDEAKGINGMLNFSDETKAEFWDSLTWDILLMAASFATGIGAMYAGGKLLELVSISRYLNKVKFVGQGFAFYEGNQFMTNLFLSENMSGLLQGINPINTENSIEITKTIIFFGAMGICNKLFGKLPLNQIMTKMHLGKAGAVVSEVLAESGIIIGIGAGIDMVFTGEHNWTYQEFLQAIMLVSMLHAFGRLGANTRVEIERTSGGGIDLKIIEKMKSKVKEAFEVAKNIKILGGKEVRNLKKDFNDITNFAQKDIENIKSSATPEGLKTRISEHREIFEEHIKKINNFDQVENLGSTFDLMLKYDKYLETLKDGDKVKIDLTKKEVQLSYKRRIKVLNSKGLIYDNHPGTLSEKSLKNDFNSFLDDMQNGGKEYVELVKPDLDLNFAEHLSKVPAEADSFGSTFSLKIKYENYIQEIINGDKVKISKARKELETAHKKRLDELNKNNLITIDETLDQNTPKTLRQNLENKIITIENGGKKFVEDNNLILKTEFQNIVHNRFPEAETYSSTIALIEKYAKFLDKVQTGNAKDIKSAKKELRDANEQRIKELIENDLMQAEPTKSYIPSVDADILKFGRGGQLTKQFKTLIEDIFNGGKKHVESKSDILKNKLKEHINQFPGCESRSRTSELEIKYSEYLDVIKTGDAEKIKIAKKELYKTHKEWIEDLKKQGFLDKTKSKETIDIKKNLIKDMKNFLDDISNATPEFFTTNKDKYKTDFQAKIDKFPEGKKYALSTELEVNFNEFLTKKQAGENINPLKNEIIKIYERWIKKLIDNKIIKLEEKAKTENTEPMISEKEKNLFRKIVKFMDSAFSNVVLDRKQIFELFQEINIFKQGTGKGLKNLGKFVLYGDPKYKFLEGETAFKKIAGTLYKSGFLLGITFNDLILEPFYHGNGFDLKKWGLDVLGYGVLNRLMFFIYMYRDFAIQGDVFKDNLLEITKEVLDVFGENTCANLVNFLSHILPNDQINDLRRGLGIGEGQSPINQSGKDNIA